MQIHGIKEEYYPQIYKDYLEDAKSSQAHTLFSEEEKEEFRKELENLKHASRFIKI